MHDEWKCAGCGIPTPGRVVRCDCPTNVVYIEGKGSAWKIIGNQNTPDVSGLAENARAELIGDIIKDICELPDRTSPDDEPDLLLVTIDELTLILRRHLFGEE